MEGIGEVRSKVGGVVIGGDRGKIDRWGGKQGVGVGGKLGGWRQGRLR